MGRLFKTLGWIILIPILAILLFYTVKDDTGQVLITGTFPLIGPKTIHTTIVGGLLLAAIAVLIIYIIVRVIITIVKTPHHLRRFSLNRKARTADKKFAQAEIALLENKPDVAEDLFLTAAKGSKSPNLCYVGAARAAQLLGKEDRRDRYLREIDLSGSKHDREIAEIKRAEILIEADESDKAEKLLKDLLSRHKSLPAVLMLGVTLQRQGKNEELFRLLPDLQKAIPRLTPSEDVTQFTQDIYKALFDYASTISQDSDQLKIVWNRLPKGLQHDPDLLIHYANRLLDVGDTKQAEGLLRKEINRTQNDRLILAYAHLYRGDQPKLLKHAKRFHETQPDSAITQYTLANMLFRSQQFEEAKTHLLKTIELDSQFAKAYQLLGEVLLAEGDKEGALKVFQQGITIMLNERPKDVKVVDGELLIESTDKLGYSKTGSEVVEGEIVDDTQDTATTKESDTESETATETAEEINNPDPRSAL